MTGGQEVAPRPTRWQGRSLYLALSAVGILAGVVSGLLGVGGGIVMVPIMAGALAFPQHAAHATSLAAIVVIAASGVVGFGRAGHVDLTLAAYLLAGALAGVYLGARSMHRISERSLRLVFALVLVIVGLRMALS